MKCFWDCIGGEILRTLLTTQSINKFKDLDEFGKMVKLLDDYRILPIKANYGDQNIGTDKVRAMTNITHNRVTMAVGPRYPLFGHRQAFGYVYEDLLKRGAEVHGSVTTLGDTAWARILFDNVSVTDETDKPVEMGIEFCNPMDKKTTFKGYGYTWRQTCSNGAGIRKLLPGLEITEAHTVDMQFRVPPMIYDFVERSMKQKAVFQTMVSRAIDSKISFDTRAQLVATLTGVFGGIVDRHVKGIAANIESLTPTRWDLFNASTAYTSHHAISPVIREQIDAKAESFINPMFQIVPAYMPRKDVTNAT
jgi:hypothetical protein